MAILCYLVVVSTDWFLQTERLKQRLKHAAGLQCVIINKSGDKKAVSTKV